MDYGCLNYKYKAQACTLLTNIKKGKVSFDEYKIYRNKLNNFIQQSKKQYLFDLSKKMVLMLKQLWSRSMP